MNQVYTDLRPNFPDSQDWTLNTVLRTHADAPFLFTPEEGLQWTYAEILASAERIAGAWHAAGAQQGDRVVIMAMNSSRLVRSWFATAVGGTVEVPINTNYEGEFLRHQIVTVDPRWAVIDDTFAERYVAIAEHCRGIEKFWVIDTGSGLADKAVALLRENGWAAEAWDALESGTPVAVPAPRAQDLGAIFFTSGTTGPSKGVAMPNAQLYFFAQEVVSLMRLTPEDRYLTTTPLFHGNAQF